MQSCLSSAGASIFGTVVRLKWCLMLILQQVTWWLSDDVIISSSACEWCKHSIIRSSEATLHNRKPQFPISVRSLCIRGRTQPRINNVSASCLQTAVGGQTTTKTLEPQPAGGLFCGVVSYCVLKLLSHHGVVYDLHGTVCQETSSANSINTHSKQVYSCS